MTILEVICKTADMQNNSMALLHVSYPLVQTCGGEGILYNFNISWTPGVLNPMTNPFLCVWEGWGAGCTLLETEGILCLSGKLISFSYSD